MGGSLAAVDRALSAIDLLRPPSPVVDHLLAELSGTDVSFARLAKLIQGDSMLTAAFLQRANSAIFQRNSSVHSVLQALTLLGIEEMRRFVLSLSSACLSPRVQLPARFPRSLYVRHCSATAVMAGLIERQLGHNFGSNTHTAALLHDVSKLLVATALPEEFNQITEHRRWDETREREILGVTHAELSSMVLEAWKMPHAVSQAVVEHHADTSAGPRQSLAALLRAADNYTAVMAEVGEPQLSDFDESVLCGLGIDSSIPSLVVEFQTQIHLAGGN